MVNKIQWDEFFKKIVLRRRISNNNLKYIGEYKLKGKTYTEELTLDIKIHNYDKDEELDSINIFAKNQIAKKLAKQINGE